MTIVADGKLQQISSRVSSMVYGKKVHGKNGHGKIGHKWKKGPRIFGPRGIKVHGVSILKHTESVKRSTKGGKKDHGSMFYVCLYDMLFQDACTG